MSTQLAVAKTKLKRAVHGPIAPSATAPSLPTNIVSTKLKQGSIRTAPSVGSANAMISAS
jgi:hypothetical protein